jgi:hypothetical protein
MIIAAGFCFFYSKKSGRLKAGRETDIRFYAERPGVMQADIAHLRHGIYILKGEHFGRKMTFKFVKM